MTEDRPLKPDLALCTTRPGQPKGGKQAELASLSLQDKEVETFPSEARVDMGDTCESLGTLKRGEQPVQRGRLVFEQCWAFPVG